MKLSIDFSQDREAEVIKANVLAFLKDNFIVHGEMVNVVVQPSGEGALPTPRRELFEGDTVESFASKIADDLARFAKGGFKAATLEIRRP